MSAKHDFLPQGWEMKKLSHLFDVKSSRRVHQSDWKSSGIPFYRAREVVKLSRDGVVENELFISQELYNEFTKDKGAPKSGDIIVSAVGTLGQCYLVKNSDKFYFKDASVLWFENTSKVDSRFIEYAFKSNSLIDQVLEGSMGATVGTLTISRAKEIKIPTPPLEEQKHIVSILDTAFEAIEKAKSNAEQNLKNSKELFESYLQNIFSTKGEGWEVKIIKEVCELKSGTTISTNLERSEGNVLYVKVGDMNLLENEVEINTSSRFVNNSEIKLNQIIPNGAIIFPKRGGAIATNKKRKIVKPTIVDLNTMAIIPGSKIDSNYFFHWFQLIDLNSISNGTSIPQINNYSFDALKIPFPKSLTHQQTIVQKIDSLSIETKRLEAIYQQKLIDLEELKKSLLEKAFKGELKTEKIEVV